tara:strand:+ start:1237 stop:1425 length:189 start_codon:yes stop_codon:yes gene_type:complete
MIHKLCDRCGKMESVDFMTRLDDDIYCEECCIADEMAFEKKCRHWLLEKELPNDKGECDKKS